MAHTRELAADEDVPVSIPDAAAIRERISNLRSEAERMEGPSDLGELRRQIVATQRAQTEHVRALEELKRQQSEGADTQSSTRETLIRSGRELEQMLSNPEFAVAANKYMRLEAASRLAYLLRAYDSASSREQRRWFSEGIDILMSADCTHHLIGFEMLLSHPLLINGHDFEPLHKIIGYSPPETLHQCFLGACRSLLRVHPTKLPSLPLPCGVVDPRKVSPLSQEVSVLLKAYVDVLRRSVSVRSTLQSNPELSFAGWPLACRLSELLAIPHITALHLTKSELMGSNGLGCDIILDDHLSPP